MNNHRLEDYVQRHNGVLEQLIHQTDSPATVLTTAMHYCLFPGGKRMRPLLIYLCGDILQVPLPVLDILAASIELMHTYSLIHDDLPAMDNDDFRRGQPSCHRAFDEATAILVGDGLQGMAIELVLTRLPALLTPTQTIAIAHELLRASGPAGMLSGQSLDLAALQTQQLSEAELIRIHELKTGQLILACINMVLYAATPSVQQTTALRQFAQQFSQVFQIQDDYLDRYDTQLGKGRASDLVNNKLTFVSCMSQDALHARIATEFKQTLETLAHITEPHAPLVQLVTQLWRRSHPDY
jgi:farnesyl diphosphate synthase